MLEKIDNSLHRDIKSLYLTTFGEELLTKKDICGTIEANKPLEQLGGQFDIIKKTNFTHPDVDYEDKYTPFLYHLRQKYSKRLENVTQIHKDFNEYKEKRKHYSKIYITESNKIILIYQEALNTLREFSSAITLKIPSDVESTFKEFKEDKYPQLFSANVTNLVDTFAKLKSLCIQDLFGRKCLLDRNQSNFEHEFNLKYAKLRDYNLKNASKVYAEDLIATVKDVMNVIQSGNEMISNSEIASNFDGLTEEYIFELKKMNKYLNDKKPVKISDFGNHLNPNGTNILNFERDFKNLIRSSKFICWNIKHPFFLPK